MTEEELQLAAFEIILHSGTARTSVHEALDAMKNGAFQEAEEKLAAADEELLQAHHAQTDLMQAVLKSKLKSSWFTHKTT